MTNVFRAVTLALVFLAVASTARAQETVADVVNFLVTNRGVQTDDFQRDRAAAEAASNTIARALLVNLTSVPLVSSSSGFLYRFNPALGTVERATESFGGFFVERALTPGAGRASFGVSAFTAGFDRLGSLPLRDGSLVTVANQFRDEPAPFDTESLTLRVRSSTMTIFGSVGITDDFEIGGALPLLQLTLDGERLNVYRGAPTVQAVGEASASGIGDIALRAKYTLASTSTAAVAAAAEVRLPTGDESNLLGAGAAAYRFLGIGSIETGRFTLHGNGGIVLGGISDELNFAGSVSVAVDPRVTVAGEVLVRRVNDLSEVLLVSERHPSISGVDTHRLLAGPAGITLANAVAGFKWNVARAVVLGAHVAFPLARRGLTAPITPSVLLEFGF
jgi:hypothetical protein